MKTKKIKEELKNLGIGFLITLVIFKIVFYSQDIFSVIKTVIGLFYVFVIPGLVLMYYWEGKFDFFTRIVVGSIGMYAIIGTLSYYIGLIGININYHHYFLPLVIILIGLFLNREKFL